MQTTIFWGSDPDIWGPNPVFWGRFPSSQHLLETPFGVMHAWVSGSPRPGRPALVTFPDVGHTHRTCFSELFGHEEMREIARSFHLVHLEPPGMEEGAPPYPPGYRPSPPPPTPSPPLTLLIQSDPRVTPE
ncbi:protein NDRG2-like [Malurus melanocephalus]|uniref:protein NDRG2-like n=1 Tax=Malurus melanocephalus TaxID=175006 RepID=UPI002548B4A0|nr:protein NDRG2-like [Malurus melanocephalus]